MISNVIGALGTVPKDLAKGARRVVNRRTNRDQIVEIDQNTEKSHGDLK